MFSVIPIILTQIQMKGEKKPNHLSFKWQWVPHVFAQNNDFMFIQNYSSADLTNLKY